MRGLCRWVVPIAAASALSVSHAAFAQDDTGMRPDPAIAFDAAPIFGGMLPQRGLGEITVRIENRHDAPIDGRLEATLAAYTGEIRTAAAEYHVDANGSAIVHMPVSTAATVFVRGWNADGRLLYRKDVLVSGVGAARIIDVEEISRIGAALAGETINPDYRPDNYYGGYGGTSPQLETLTARIAPETGDPILPMYGVGWQGVHVALVPAETLALLDGVELEALASFVLSGGTLAVVVRRPDDLRSAALASFAGGQPVAARPSPVEIETRIVPAPPQPPAISKWPVIPDAPLSTTEVQGFVGGNLVPSAFGASAAYGLGQVVLLGFDPTRPEVAVDPWVQIRVTELVRQAYERSAITAVEPGGSPTMAGHGGFEPSAYDGIRRLLDPNESARWGIAVAAIFLCVYAVIAGPIVFSRAKKRGRPLLALAILPLLSFVAFLLVVGLGFVAKGTSARARHLTIVDAGAGMNRGVARRFRGFFLSRATSLDVVPNDRTAALVSNARTLEEGRAEDGWTAVDRDGSYLSGVLAAPWQTLVVREDGLASIGRGVSITERAGSSELMVRNLTTKPLKAVIVKLANDEFRFAQRIDAGATFDTGSALRQPPGFRLWSQRVATTRVLGRAHVHGLNADSMGGGLGPENASVAAAWLAIDGATADSVDWFPTGVPVVLAEVVGGEGREKDSGVSIDSDRMLLRVVGFGGEP